MASASDLGTMRDSGEEGVSRVRVGQEEAGEAGSSRRGSCLHPPHTHPSPSLWPVTVQSCSLAGGGKAIKEALGSPRTA